MKQKPKRFYVTQYAAIFNRNKMLMLRNVIGSKYMNCWVFPGGHIDEDKNPIAALAREVKEETNLNLKGAIIFKSDIKKYPTGWRYVVYYKCRATGKIKLDYENDAYRWASLSDVGRMKLRDKKEKRIVLELLKRKKEPR